MARERMAKLPKYGHDEAQFRPYNHQFHDDRKLHHHDMLLEYRYLGSWPPDGETGCAMTSATPRSVENVSAKLNIRISRTKRKRHTHS